MTVHVADHVVKVNPGTSHKITFWLNPQTVSIIHSPTDNWVVLQNWVSSQKYFSCPLGCLSSEMTPPAPFYFFKNRKRDSLLAVCYTKYKQRPWSEKKFAIHLCPIILLLSQIYNTFSIILSGILFSYAIHPFWSPPVFNTFPLIDSPPLLSYLNGKSIRSFCWLHYPEHTSHFSTQICILYKAFSMRRTAFQTPW